MKIETRHIWLLVACLAAVQLSVAVFAVYSSNKNILSDGACIGGVFGSLVNLGIFLVASVIMIVLGVRSIWVKTAHAALSPLFVLAVTSVLSIAIGLQAGLRCTV